MDVELYTKGSNFWIHSTGRWEKVLNKLAVVYIQKDLTFRYTAQTLNLFNSHLFSNMVHNQNINIKKERNKALLSIEEVLSSSKTLMVTTLQLTWHMMLS